MFDDFAQLLNDMTSGGDGLDVADLEPPTDEGGLFDLHDIGPADAVDGVDPALTDLTLPTADLGPWEQGEAVPDAPEADRYVPGSLLHTTGGADRLDDFWHYQGPENACAVVAQGSIIESITGVEFDQQRATSWLQHNGWYDPGGGTLPEDVTRFLDAHGLAHTDGTATIVDIYDALQRGDRVMSMLDANEVWYPMDDPVTGEPVEWQRPAGHAVWVIDMGYDPQDGEWKVVLNDSGHPGGRAATVALDDFVNATEDYGSHTVVVDGSGGRTPAGAGR